MQQAADYRYSRQERFAALGPDGQRRIAESRVVVVGCGALGSAQAELLGRAGVGHLRIVDRDYVELSNLQRQFLFDESDAAEGLPKAVAAARRLRAVNSTIEVEPVVADLTPSNADDLLGGVDLILDGTDNFEARYLMNDYAVSRDIPWIYGAAVGSYGIKMAVLPGRTACFRCVYPEPPGGCSADLRDVRRAGTRHGCSCVAADSGRVEDPVGSHGFRRDCQLIFGRNRSGRFADRRAIRNVRASRAPVRTSRGRRAARPREPLRRNAVQIHERTRPADLGDLAATRAGGRVRFNEFARCAQRLKAMR